MNKNRTGALVGLVTAMLVPLAAQPTSAAPTAPAQPTEPTVPPVPCGTLRIPTPAPYTRFTFADGTVLPRSPKGYVDIDHAAAGRHVVQEVAESPDMLDETWLKDFTVRPCSAASPRLRADGDQDGDGRADVLAVQKRTGDLYYYRMTSTGLADGRRIGTGWSHMTWMKMLTVQAPTGSIRHLYAVRDDGTLWHFDVTGTAQVSHGRQIADGLTGFHTFAMGTENWDPNTYYGTTFLVGSKGKDTVRVAVTPTGTSPSWRLVASLPSPWAQDPVPSLRLVLRTFVPDDIARELSVDADGTMWTETIERGIYVYGLGAKRRVGRGWNHMSQVVSPGSLDGDQLDDLVAVREDGNLYQYTNTGGAWGPARQIGRNWNGVTIVN